MVLPLKLKNPLVQSLGQLCSMFDKHYLTKTQKIISERTESIHILFSAAAQLPKFSITRIVVPCVSYNCSCTCQANSATHVEGDGIDFAFNANQIWIMVSWRKKNINCRGVSRSQELVSWWRWNCRWWRHYWRGDWEEEVKK